MIKFLIETEEKEGKEKMSRNRGITLIALVLTIIILLILAGITLVGLTGENGLIKENQAAKELTEKADLEERVELAIIRAEQKHINPGLDNVIEEIKNNKVISNTNQVDKGTGTITTDKGYEITGKLDDYIEKPLTAEEALSKKSVLNENETTRIKDQYGNIAKIPAGFKIAEDSGTDVTKGIVIEDVSAGATTTKESQFVWIPVGDVKTLEGNIKNIELNRYSFVKDDETLKATAEKSR